MAVLSRTLHHCSRSTASAATIASNSVANPGGRSAPVTGLCQTTSIRATASAVHGSETNATWAMTRPSISARNMPNRCRHPTRPSVVTNMRSQRDLVHCALPNWLYRVKGAGCAGAGLRAGARGAVLDRAAMA